VAKGKAADAAKKVAQAFVAGDNIATKTGKFSARDKVTAPSCTWCATKKTAVLKIYGGGGHVEGELFTKNTFTVTGPGKASTPSSSTPPSANTRRSTDPAAFSTAAETVAPC